MMVSERPPDAILARLSEPSSTMFMPEGSAMVDEVVPSAVMPAVVVVSWRAWSTPLSTRELAPAT